MSTARLTFLYPHLFRTIRVSETAVRTARHCRKRVTEVQGRQYASITTTTVKAKGHSTFVKRHGKAVEPVVANEKNDAASRPLTSTEETGKSQEIVDELPTSTPEEVPSPTPNVEAASNVQEAPPTNESKAPVSPAPDLKADAKKSGPLQAVLHMGPPEEVAKQHHHLTAPPYVHHFDSYSLVKQLEIGGYTKEQAIIVMKAVRGLLAQNLDVAQDSLVSKSDVENETYLFQAACSELSTEVKNNQRVADEEMRQKRTHLQHEVDILTQSLNQEVLTLNDNVRGMFNDRKMAVREQQKAGDSSIQQINYKITINLNSEAKSEIEGLRWVLIRRSVIGIVFLVILTFGTLRYGSFVSHNREKEAELAKKEAERLRMADGKRDHSSAPDAAEILAAN